MWCLVLWDHFGKRVVYYITSSVKWVLCGIYVVYMWYINVCFVCVFQVIFSQYSDTLDPQPSIPSSGEDSIPDHAMSCKIINNNYIPIVR